MIYAFSFYIRQSRRLSIWRASKHRRFPFEATSLKWLLSKVLLEIDLIQFSSSQSGPALCQMPTRDGEKKLSFKLCFSFSLFPLSFGGSGGKKGNFFPSFLSFWAPLKGMTKNWKLLKLRFLSLSLSMSSFPKAFFYFVDQQERLLRWRSGRGGAIFFEKKKRKIIDFLIGFSFFFFCLLCVEIKRVFSRQIGMENGELLSTGQWTFCDKDTKYVTIAGMDNLSYPCWRQWKLNVKRCGWTKQREEGEEMHGQYNEEANVWRTWKDLGGKWQKARPADLSLLLRGTRKPLFLPKVC